MTDHILHLYKSQFVRLCSIVFEIANMEHHHRNNRFLHRASKKECTDFEYRFQRTDNTIRGLLNTLFNLNIALSLISQYPSDEYMQQYHYSAKGYSIYHYSVICHSLSTIRDLYRKLINQVCKCGVTEDGKGNISWKRLEATLMKDEQKYGDVLQCLNDFHASFNKYINDRQRSSHEGLLFSSLFNDMEATDFVTDMVENHGLKKYKVQYLRGSKENISLIKQSKQNYVDSLEHVMHDAYSNVCNLFDALQTILLKDLCPDLASNISCWNRVPTNASDNMEEYLKKILKTQVRAYWTELEEVRWPD